MTDFSKNVVDYGQGGEAGKVKRLRTRKIKKGKLVPLTEADLKEAERDSEKRRKHRESVREWRRNNPEKAKAQAAKWRAKNQHLVREYEREAWRRLVENETEEEKQERLAKDREYQRKYREEKRKALAFYRKYKDRGWEDEETDG